MTILELARAAVSCADCFSDGTLQRAGIGMAQPRQRLDFVMLGSKGRKIVVEVDGPTHIADTSGRPDFAGYQAQLTADRGLMLEGYEVYTFGADEFAPDVAAKTVDHFIERLRLTVG